MTGKRVVLLDFGGTLDSDGKHWSTQFADSLAASGIELPRLEVDAAFLAADRAMNDDPRSATLGFPDYVREYVDRILSLAPGEGPPGAMDRASAVAEHFVDQAQARIRCNAEILARHRALCRFAVVSNFTANLPRILDEVGLGRTLERVFCSAIEGVRKPDTAMFRLALGRLGIAGDAAGARAAIAMIGDSLANDIVPAKALGLTTVWLRGDRNHGGGHPSAADHVAGNLEDALAALSRAPAAEAASS